MSMFFVMEPFLACVVFLLVLLMHICLARTVQPIHLNHFFEATAFGIGNFFAEGVD